MLLIGGSLKKYNKSSLNMILLGFIIPILLFIPIINVTYAYFTAKSKVEAQEASIGDVTISFDDGTSAKLNTTVISNSLRLMPGDTLNFEGSVVNAGTIPFYAIFELKLNIKKTATGSVEETSTCYYTLTNSGSTYNSTASEITITTEGSTTTYDKYAFVVQANATQNTSQNFKISHEFDGLTYDNAYQGAKVTYSLKVCAIQYYVLTEQEATKELISYANN